MKDFLKTIRWIAAAVVGALVALFVIQNAAVIELQFLGATMTSRRAFVVIASVLLGFALGWLFGITSRRQ